MCLPCTISETFNANNGVYLRYKLGIIQITSLVCKYNYLVPLSSYVNVMLQNIVTLKSWLTQGHCKWHHLVDAYTNSYSFSIVTMAISCIVAEIK